MNINENDKFYKIFHECLAGKWEPEEEEKLCEIVYKLSSASPGLSFECWSI